MLGIYLFVNKEGSPQNSFNDELRSENQYTEDATHQVASFVLLTLLLSFMIKNFFIARNVTQLKVNKLAAVFRRS